jgi:hypothetical protein
MHVDKPGFFLAMSALAAGGLGGYVAAKSGVLDRLSTVGVAERQAPTTPSATPPSGTPLTEAPSSAALAVTPASAPVCDDMMGTPGVCPQPGYSADEGGCGGLATQRCQDFKQSMKPRVAERGVACLSALTPAQRCDTRSLNACGHAALMSACSADLGAVAGAPSDELESRCRAITMSCGASPMTPTARDCRTTLAGMTTAGRDRMGTCMASHCGDLGLLGCESASPVR